MDVARLMSYQLRTCWHISWALLTSSVLRRRQKLDDDYDKSWRAVYGEFNSRLQLQ